MKKQLVIIDDIQIRLKTIVDGITFVTTWWGPKDPMRFAAVKKNELVNVEESDESLKLKEDIAIERFTEIIKELQNVFDSVIC
jgi:hypothetical protein